MKKQYQGKDYMQLLNETLFPEAADKYNYAYHGSRHADEGGADFPSSEEDDEGNDDFASGFQVQSPEDFESQAKAMAGVKTPQIGSARAEPGRVDVEMSPAAKKPKGSVGLHDRVKSRQNIDSMQSIMNNLTKLSPGQLAKLDAKLQSMFG